MNNTILFSFSEKHQIVRLFGLCGGICEELIPKGLVFICPKAYTYIKKCIERLSIQKERRPTILCLSNQPISSNMCTVFNRMFPQSPQSTNPVFLDS